MLEAVITDVGIFYECSNIMYVFLIIFANKYCKYLNNYIYLVFIQILYLQIQKCIHVFKIIKNKTYITSKYPPVIDYILYI